MAFVLTPQPPIADWLADFDDFAKRSPGFFAGRPVVVDISLMPPARPDLVHMVTELKRRNIAIMGLDGRAPGELGADARGLPPILSGGKEISQVAAACDAIASAAGGGEGADAPERAAEPAQDAASSLASEVAIAALEAVEKAVEEPAEGAPAHAKIIAAPVRSGQSVVHMAGDVTVIGSVASGSEIVAGGSIHVYGALRGRAVAGASGDRRARIFAQSLDAELIAIDGLYKTAEDLAAEVKGKAVQAWLDGEALKLAAF